MDKTYELKKLTLVFENTEYIEFNGEDIEMFSVGGLDRTMTMLNMSPDNLLETTTCQELAIAIKSSGNTPYEMPDFKKLENGKFGRILMWKDIVRVELKIVETRNGMPYGGLQERTFYPVWDVTEDAENLRQRTIEYNGSLYILVSKESTLEDTFWRLNSKHRPTH